MIANMRKLDRIRQQGLVISPDIVNNSKNCKVAHDDDGCDMDKFSWRKVMGLSRQKVVENNEL